MRIPPQDSLIVSTMPIDEKRYAATPGAHNNPLIFTDAPSEKNVSDISIRRLNRKRTPRYENNVWNGSLKRPLWNTFLARIVKRKNMQSSWGNGEAMRYIWWRTYDNISSIPTWYLTKVCPSWRIRKIHCIGRYPGQSGSPLIPNNFSKMRNIITCPPGYTKGPVGP